MSEANQLFVTSKKKTPEQYGAGNWSYFCFDEAFEAYKKLKPASFGLYLFFLCDRPNFTRTLYKTEFIEKTGYKKTAYYAALQELKKYGYLQHGEGGHWYFHPEGDN